MGNIARPLALDLQRNLGRSSVTPMLNPSAVAQRAASIRTSVFYDGQPAPVDPANPPQQQWPNSFSEPRVTSFGTAPEPIYTPPYTPADYSYTPPSYQSPYRPTATAGGSGAGYGRQTWETVGGGSDANNQRLFYAKTIDDLLAAEQRAADLRAQSAALNATLATASYDAQLRIIGGEIARYQAALGKVDAQWAEWNTKAQAAIAATVDATEAAYATYIDLLNQGFSEYDALTQSRYAEYQATVRSLVGQYTTTTNTTYEEFIASLPGTYGPAITAIASGNQAAVAAIHAEKEAARNTVEGQVVASTQQFGKEMERIGADNPALAQELLADLNANATLALEGIELTGTHGAAMEAAAGEIAKRTVQYQLASEMRASEEERVTLVNDAARQRHQLLTASSQELAGILEQSGASRAQMLVDVNAALDAQLAGLDEASDQIRREATEAAQEMKYEISESIRNMVNQQYQTGTNRRVAYTTAMQAGEGQDGIFSANDLAATNMLERLDMFDALRVNTNRRDSLAATVAGWFTTGEITTLAGLNAILVDPTDERSLLPAEEKSWLRAAVTAYASALEHYDEVYGPRAAAAQGQVMPAGSYRIAGPNSYYGPRNLRGESQFHHGVDLHADPGTPFSALLSGIIARYRNAEAGYGVQITTDDGQVLRYAHMDSYTGVPANGTRVNVGDMVGLVGATGEGERRAGNANAPHLHLSYKINGQFVDPIASGLLVP